MFATKLLARRRCRIPRLSCGPSLTTSTTSTTTRLYQSNANTTKFNLKAYYEEFQWVPSLMGRLAAAFGMLHVMSEYGFELTLCEGPSMLPTIYPYGEIILVDRLSPRLNGMEGGMSGEDRLKASRQRQGSFEEKHPADAYQWHEHMVPVNELPSSDVWWRFWKQLATPISVGDVVVVQHPDRRGTICKRVLGLPGDMVVKPPNTMRRRRRQQQQPGGARDNNNLLIIPDGHIWIEGDNSMNSSDSRNYGPIPAAMIVGRVLCRIWPLRGSALMQRGARPMPPKGAPFSGSTILPAGYEGEEIIKAVVDDSKRKPQPQKEERS